MAYASASSASLRGDASTAFKSGRLLVVLGVLEGRNFPKRPKHQLIVEATFDSESLDTDSKPHSEMPGFAQELAWELNRKSLQHHRLQRSSVKVKFFAVDQEQSAKEQVGYVILPVRSAGTKPTPQWHPLLSSKYSKTKPEARLSLYVDEGDGSSVVDSQISGVEQTVETTSGAADSTYKDSTVASLTSAEMQALTPRLDEEEGWYLIGDQNDPQNKTFTLCITVAFAANLKHLLPPGVPIKCPSSTADSSGGFFFFYTLFGNSVTTDPFFDVLEPNFPSERASVRVRTSFDKLDLFLRLQHPGIEIHLCFGAQSLGKASLPIHSLLEGRSSQIFMQPVSVEETYRLLPKSTLASSSSHAEGIPQDAFPMVGVAMTVKLDESEMPSSGEALGGETAVGEEGGGRRGGLGGASRDCGSSAKQEAPASESGTIPVITIEDSYMDTGCGDGAGGGQGGGGGDVVIVGSSAVKKLPSKPETSREIDLMAGGDATSGIAKQASRPRDDANTESPAVATDVAAATAATREVSPTIAAPSPSSALAGPTPTTASSLRQDLGHPSFGPSQNDFTPLPVPSLPNVVPQPASLVSQALPPSASTAIPPSSHHLCCTIELRSYKDLNPSFTDGKLVFLRYLYPFFGFNEPLHTFPASRVFPSVETMLPNSYCAFDFASPLPHLNQTFTNHPLMVELWARSVASGHPNSPQMVDPRTDSLLGIAKLPLLQLLQSTPTSVSVPTSSADEKGPVEQKRIERRMFGAQVPVVAIPIDGPASLNAKASKIGEISTVLCLSDYGLFEGLSFKSDSVPPSEPPRAPSPTLAKAPPVVENPAPSETPRESLEYKAALELELWKEKQMEQHSETLKHKEASHLQALSLEYKRRERERELMMKQKISEYSQLETQLRGTLAQLESKQKSLDDKEKEVERLAAHLKRDYEEKVNQIRNESRRLIDDADHKVTLEQKNARSLEEQITKLRHELNQAEAKIGEKEKEFDNFKSVQKTQPEVRLQQQLHILTLEKHELEKKAEAATKSKLHYKQQWGRTLKELARFKQKEAEGARERLKAQEHELDHLRLRYLVNEEREVAKSDNKQVDALRAEVASLRFASKGHPDLDHIPQPGPPSDEVGKQNGVDGGGGGTGGRISPLNLDGVVGDAENDLNRNNRVSLSTRRSSEAPPSRRIVSTAADEQLDEQVARLIEERDTLLQTGVYSGKDRIILELDRQINEKIQQKRGGLTTFHNSVAH